MSPVSKGTPTWSFPSSLSQLLRYLCTYTATMLLGFMAGPCRRHDGLLSRLLSAVLHCMYNKQPISHCDETLCKGTGQLRDCTEA